LPRSNTTEFELDDRRIVWVQQTERGSHVKARWFSLLLGLAASAALLTLDAAARPLDRPPPGTPGVAAAAGTPGTITFTQYAADGRTVLDVIRVAASASDTSASVAARLGRSAPNVVKGGPEALPGSTAEARSESSARSRTVSSVKRIGRLADCCSSSGCGELDVTREITSDIFGTWLGTFHHRVYWCWSYPRITGINVACWSEVDGSFIDDRGCDGWGSYYAWRGSSRGGHVSYRQGDWGNCVMGFGCFKNIYPWIEIWVNGNGAWAQDQGG
jgi:hypothetical protein